MSEVMSIEERFDVWWDEESVMISSMTVKQVAMTAWANGADVAVNELKKNVH